MKSTNKPKPKGGYNHEEKIKALLLANRTAFGKYHGNTKIKREKR